MQVGDVVRMLLHKDEDEFRWEEWGTGIILSIEGDMLAGDYDVEILWSEIGVSWETASMLEVLS